MVVNQWHVIQAEQPNGFIDEWRLKLLLEKQRSSWVTRAGKALLQLTVLPTLSYPKLPWTKGHRGSSGPFLHSTGGIPWGR